MPSVDSRPCVGFRPHVPQKAAGILAEPPVSETRLSGTMPAATAIADPPLDPPVILVGSHGFRVGPHDDSRFVTPAASSCWLVFPITIAPSSRSRVTSAASRSAGSDAIAAQHPVVGYPRTSNRSLTAIDIPAS